MTQQSPFDRIGPHSSLPLALRLRWGWGAVLTFILGGGATYVAYLQYGWAGLHGIWVAAVLLLAYLFVQDHFRVRSALEQLLVCPLASTTDPITHYRSGPHPNSIDYQFRPDGDTKKNVGTEVCQTSVLEDVIKVSRPHPQGRYIACIQNYESGALIPARNRLTRNIRVAFSYKTSGPRFTVAVRLRDKKQVWLKDPYGKCCCVKLELTSTDWSPAAPVLLVLATHQQELMLSVELLSENNPPGPDASLFLRDVTITEDR